MFIFKKKDFDIEYKIFYKNGDMYMCGLETDEFRDLENQECWRLPDIEDGGLR